jgi:rRNA maturation endonuclease Nob1
MNFQIPEEPLGEIQERPYRFRCQHCGRTTHLVARSPAKCEQCGSFEGVSMPEAGYAAPGRPQPRAQAD